jgi:hypothetical protein
LLRRSRTYTWTSSLHISGPDYLHRWTQGRRGETTVAFDLLTDIAGAAGLEALGDEASKLFHGGSGSSTPSSTAGPQRRGIGFDILKDIAGSAGLEALGDEASKLFHGDSTTAPSAQPTLAPGTLSARFELPASVTDKATTKLLGFLGGLTASSGVDALFHHFEGNSTLSTRSAPASAAELVSTIEHGGYVTQADADALEAHLLRTLQHGQAHALAARFELPEIKLGSLTKGLVSLVGSLAASGGVDALFHEGSGNSTVSARAEETQEGGIHARTEMEARGVVSDFFGKLTDLIPLKALLPALD